MWSLATALLETTGDMGSFGLRALRDAFSRPWEIEEITHQIFDVGWRSGPLIITSGLAVGIVMSLHTRSAMVRFGSESMIPAVTALAVFRELGPLVAGLLVAGRVGAGIGSELAQMRVTEQIDALEALAIDSFKYLVVTRVAACIIALPILTTLMSFSGLFGGFLSEAAISHMTVQLYFNRAFQQIGWTDYIPPTIKTAVFGFIIGSVSSFLGYTAKQGAVGVGRAATRSVVLSSLLLIVADVVLVKVIFFWFPESSQ